MESGALDLLEGTASAFKEAVGGPLGMQFLFIFLHFYDQLGGGFSPEEPFPRLQNKIAKGVHKSPVTASTLFPGIGRGATGSAQDKFLFHQRIVGRFVHNFQPLVNLSKCNIFEILA